MVLLPSGVPSWALVEKKVFICILFPCLILLLVLILGCSGVQIPAQEPSGNAEFLLLGRTWILTQDLGQGTSSVQRG